MRQPKITVLAYGEGDDEKIFLRHLEALYCRRKLVSVRTGSAGGGSPSSILMRAKSFRWGYRRDFEFILLDTDKTWPPEMIDLAAEEEIKLIGSSPCLEAFFLDILQSPHSCKGVGSKKCKEIFETHHCSGHNFTEEECARLFPKAFLNEARKRNEDLNYIITAMEGTL
ncbi:MAG: hypothetical protein PHD04_00125 [Candidatus Pacebacteria bacterium]|nr:hypothetical protein [Candidatus Paceibacterota bacterium]